MVGDAPDAAFSVTNTELENIPRTHFGGSAQPFNSQLSRVLPSLVVDHTFASCHGN